MNETKLCKKCQKEKTLDCFRENLRTKDKKFPWCRECQDIVNNYLYEKNKQKRLAQITKWNESHPDKLKEYKKNWRENKKEQIISQSSNIESLSQR